ncbi:hypothetical protein GKA01_25230 [Gluconobacter kanchanaburiensis NBRC 103587]|uniref:Uncharacterized protein n=1 Tax=Gluconobacter kanchanaburiensis NBRC 103587 TaxID=1307948 RepID=A0A511BA77_9PROT|nr:hypothetical protein GKA01_25230 [Gluconobacter kanchanaburiensis NBRC 103587]
MSVLSCLREGHKAETFLWGEAVEPFHNPISMFCPGQSIQIETLPPLRMPGIKGSGRSTTPDPAHMRFVLPEIPDFATLLMRSRKTRW